MSEAAMQPDQVVVTLNSLIELNRDGQKGYEEAAEKIETPRIKEFCLEQSRARGRFVVDLRHRCDRWAALRRKRAALQRRCIAVGSI